MSYSPYTGVGAKSLSGVGVGYPLTPWAIPTHPLTPWGIPTPPFSLVPPGDPGKSTLRAAPRKPPNATPPHAGPPPPSLLLASSPLRGATTCCLPHVRGSFLSPWLEAHLHRTGTGSAIPSLFPTATARGPCRRQAMETRKTSAVLKD